MTPSQASLSEAQRVQVKFEVALRASGMHCLIILSEFTYCLGPARVTVLAATGPGTGTSDSSVTVNHHHESEPRSGPLDIRDSLARPSGNFQLEVIRATVAGRRGHGGSLRSRGPGRRRDRKAAASESHTL